MESGEHLIQNHRSVRAKSLFYVCSERPPLCWPTEPVFCTRRSTCCPLRLSTSRIRGSFIPEIFIFCSEKKNKREKKRLWTRSWAVYPTNRTGGEQILKTCYVYIIAPESTPWSSWWRALCLPIGQSSQTFVCNMSIGSKSS